MAAVPPHIVRAAAPPLPLRNKTRRPRSTHVPSSQLLLISAAAEHTHTMGNSHVQKQCAAAAARSDCATEIGADGGAFCHALPQEAGLPRAANAAPPRRVSFTSLGAMEGGAASQTHPSPARARSGSHAGAVDDGVGQHTSACATRHVRWRDDACDSLHSRLHAAARTAAIQELTQCLEKGADVAAARDEAGCTAVHTAAACGHAAALTVLLRAAPSVVHAISAAGMTPLHSAALHSTVRT
ncbi:ankyrin repeat domain-containing protein, partial [archaeon]